MPVITVQVATRTPEQAKEPILYKLAHDFNVVTNVRRAQIAEDYGFVEIDIEGTLEEEPHRGILARAPGRARRQIGDPHRAEVLALGRLGSVPLEHRQLELPRPPHLHPSEVETIRH